MSLADWQQVLAVNLTGSFLFLANDAASFVTGSDLLVDGGYTVI